jgi:hypothetical protein
MYAISAPRADALRNLRRRIITGNVIAYAGMFGAIYILVRGAPAHPLVYGLAGAAVGLGTGLAYLSLYKLRQRDRSVHEEKSHSR